MIATPEFGLNFDFNDTAVMLRQSVFNFAQAEIAPHAAEIDLKNAVLVHPKMLLTQTLLNLLYRA